MLCLLDGHLLEVSERDVFEREDARRQRGGLQGLIPFLGPGVCFCQVGPCGSFGCAEAYVVADCGEHV